MAPLPEPEAVVAAAIAVVAAEMAVVAAAAVVVALVIATVAVVEAAIAVVAVAAAAVVAAAWLPLALVAAVVFEDPLEQAARVSVAASVSGMMICRARDGRGNVGFCIEWP